MAQKKSELRTFEGGVNADDSLSFIKPNELVNAINVTAQNNYQRANQQQNAISPIFDSVAISFVNDILIADGGTHTLLGVCNDERSQTVFLFYYSSLGLHKIIRYYAQGSGFANVVLRNSDVTGGLGWTIDMFISARTQGNLLIWTDGRNRQRCLNFVNPIAPPLSQDMLAFAQVPYPAPLKVQRITDPTIITTYSTQYSFYQFCYRIKNVNGFESVLSPLSETVPPVRASAISADSFSGNTIKCELNFSIKIESDWEQFDFCVKQLDTNNIFVFNTLYRSIAADVTKVALHNAGTTALNATFVGKTTSILDTISATKQFQSLPITSKFMEVSNNRVLFANNEVGLSSPDTFGGGITVTATNRTCTLPDETVAPIYLILAKNYDVNDEDFPIYGGLFIEIPEPVSGDVVLYALPEEYSKLRFNGSNILYLDTRVSFPYLPPKYISRKNLIPIAGNPFDYTTISAVPYKLAYLMTLVSPINNGFKLSFSGFSFNRALCRMIWQLHGIGNLVDDTGAVPSGDWHASTSTPSTGYVGISFFRAGYMGVSGAINTDVIITDTPDEFPASGNGRCFLPTATYRLGGRYFDWLMRPCGDVDMGKYTAPAYNPTSRLLTEKINLNITSLSNDAPDWAKYFAVTMSKNSLSSNFITFVPNCIKAARRGKDGIIYVTSDLANNIKSDDLYGIAIPLSSLAAYNVGYSFNEGDYISLEFGEGYYLSTYTYKAKITGVIDGHIICVAYNTEQLVLYLSAQYSFISSPTFIGAGNVASNDEDFTGVKNDIRQTVCYATIYIGEQADNSNYEVGVLGNVEIISLFPNLKNFFNGTGVSASIDIFGDCYTQIRESSAGGFTGVSITSNESTPTNLFIGNSGRISPVDRVGFQIVPNEIRWGNVGLPYAQFNGLSSFDSSDYKLIDIAGGDISMIIANLGTAATNDMLLITCKNNSYYALLGQSVLRSTTNVPTVSQSSNFIDNINELTGKPACESPRSFANYNGSIFWVDALNRKVWQFYNGDANIISDLSASRVFNILLAKAINESDTRRISGGINANTGEYMLFVPTLFPETRPNLPTSAVPYPSDFYYGNNYNYVFDSKAKKWRSIIDKPKQYFSINNYVLSWDATAQRMYREFIDSNDIIGDALISIPFNSDYNNVKSPLTLVVDATRPPDETWVQALTNTRIDLSLGLGDTMVANVGDWIYREGNYQCAILRDRLSNAASSSPEYNASGLNGSRLKGKVILVTMIWHKDNGLFSVKSCQLNYSS